MRRRSRIGGEPVKTRRRKTVTRKNSNAPKVAVRRSPPAGQETEVVRLTRELHEAQEQQRATGEILGVVARSRTDVQSVLDTVCQNAAQLCEAYDAAIGGRMATSSSSPPIMVRSLKSSLFRWSAVQSWVVQFSISGPSILLISKPRGTNFL